MNGGQKARCRMDNDTHARMMGNEGNDISDDTYDTLKLGQQRADTIRDRDRME